jgi:mannose-6-phosphate isomerase-like protein (cupin superfamily)
MHGGWPVTDVEKHFHDYDETWLVLGGRGVAYWIDHDNNREDFVLEEGDVWMIPAGYEHGSDGPNSEDFKLVVFTGTLPPGSHTPGHYYIEKEGYVPSLELKKTPTNRYKSEAVS